MTAAGDRLTIGMQTIQPVKRGGRRIGAGRPKGSGRYGELTVPVRVPVGIIEELGLENILRKAKRKLPLFVVGKPNEKRDA